MDLTALSKELAARLRSIRARLNLTLREAAKSSGVHYVSISRYEQGDSLPTLENLIKLATCYGVQASSLVPDHSIAALPPSPKRVKKSKRAP